MRYVGGKSKIARKISAVMLEKSKGRDLYIEPFVGGGSVANCMGNHFRLVRYSDAHKSLIMMWNKCLEALVDGKEPTSYLPDDATEDDYLHYRSSEDSAERGAVGFLASFGASWFGGFARGKKSDGTPRNYYLEGMRNINSNFEKMMGKRSTYFVVGGYKELWPELPTGSVVYCDPPYAGKKKYKTEEFDHEEFWQWVRENSARGVDIYVSEYTAPDDFVVIWEQEVHISVSVNNNKPKATERLYVHRSFYERM